MHRYILHNDDVLEASETCLSAGQIGLLSGWGVFSTIRVFDGVLFAYERHYARMKRDAAKMRVPFPGDSGYIEKRLTGLIEANQVTDAALRVVVVRNQGGLWEGPGQTRDFDLIALLSPVKNWGSGVRLGLVPQARHAASPFAGTKILTWGHNLCMAEEAQSQGFHEVILLNERGEVSECTSANIFAAFGDRVLTPPLRSGCLPGVTREILLEAVQAPGITIEEKDLMPADLEGADEIFITSTTRNLLPVVHVEGLRIRNEGSARLQLDTAFSAYVDAYVRQKGSKSPQPVAR